MGKNIRMPQINTGTSLSQRLKNLLFFIILVVFLSFMITTYLISENERRLFTSEESEKVIRTLSSNISSDMGKYASLSRLIMTEGRLLTFLRADMESVDISMINDARYGIMDILNVTEGVDCVMVFREDNIMVATNRFTYRYNYEWMTGEAWKGDINAEKGKIVVSLNSSGIAEKSDGRPVVSIGRAIYDIDSQKRTGTLMMNISTTVFEKMLGTLGYEDICIMGEDGTFLCGNRDYAEYFEEGLSSRNVIHKNIRMGGQNMLLSGVGLEKLPIVILRISPYGNKGIPFRLLYALFFLLAVFVGLMVYTGVFVRRNITEPVFELSASMEKNRQFGMLQKIQVDMPSTELAMLENDYNGMIDHVNALIQTLMEKEKTLQRAELRVLQEQIKPHFLYNSIDTIGYMALEAGAAEVHEALETLGSFYRNFLSKGDRNIPLSRELWIVKDYLSLQKLRYGDILEDEYDIGDDTKEFIVPKLILQPLVENSIYHGIRMKGEKGTIRITARLLEGELHLTVRDTGIGMKQEEIDRILSKTSGEKEDPGSESFGLWGTIERVRYYAGREDVVNIRSEIGEYTEVEFVIPDLRAPRGGREDGQDLQSDVHR